MATTVLKSLADASGNTTQISFNPARASITGVEARDRAGNVLYALPVAGAAQCAFQIAFRRLDLAQPANNQPDCGVVVYSIWPDTPDKKPTVTTGTNNWNFRYAVAAFIDQPQNGAPPLPAFDTINVDLTARAPSDAASKGWIDFDLQFGYPSQIVNGDTRYGWEVIVNCPQVNLPAAAAGMTLLHPAGKLGALSTMTTAAGGTTMPVQFAALYQPGISGARNTLQGVAFSATDETGHEKRLEILPLRNGNSNDYKLALGLICPIHLKQGAYVRPAVFKLSVGDAQGFGGAKMTFRLRAFQIAGAMDGAPVNWMDVAALYRAWVRTRAGTIWRRHDPAIRTNAPLEKMAPYTIVCNYALDGAADAGDAAQTQVARWLEQHPMVAGDPDIAGNTQEAVPALLNRVRAAFGATSGANAVPLEAQIWGFEMGGYYRFLAGLPPLTDLLGASMNSLTGELRSTPDDKGQSHLIAEQPVLVAGNTPFDETTGSKRARRKPDVTPRWPAVRLLVLPSPQGWSFVTYLGGYIPYWPGEYKARGELHPTVPGGYIPYWLRPPGGSAPLSATNIETRYVEPHVDDYIPWYARPRGELQPTVPGGYIPYWLKPPGGNTSLAGTNIETHYIEPHVDDYIPWYVKPRQTPLSATEATKGSALPLMLAQSPMPPVLMLNAASTASRFKSALDALNAAGVVPCITTTPMSMGFHRWRFRGHRVQAGGAWQDAIPYDFPLLMQAALSSIADTNGRMLQVNESHPDVSVWTAQLKRRCDGSAVENHNALAGFYQLDQRAMCPTTEVEQRYVNGWLHNDDHTGILNYGARLVEFMLHNTNLQVCYDKRHQHIVPKPAASAAYDNAIGYGPWYVNRMKSLLGKVNELRSQLGLPFSLANEFVPSEHLAAYFDEWYDRNSSAAVYNDTRAGIYDAPLFQFVFSEITSARMDMIEHDTLSHSGYQERRTNSAPVIASPAYMLSPDRDNDTDTSPTLAEWRNAADQYFAQHFAVEQYGLAPRGYVTQGNTAYSYVRGVQAVMNLRSVFFRIGAAAVLGERMLLPAAWLESPNDYLQEAINMTARAARCHMQFAPIFRAGTMLGSVFVTQGNRVLKAWRIRWRDFDDVPVLAAQTVNSHAGPDEVRPVTDRISRATDRDDLSHPIMLSQIQARVWQKGSTVLYCFANVGNSDVALAFNYTHGLAAGAKPRKIYTFNTNGAPQISASKNVKFGDAEAFTLPARCIATIEVTG